MVWKLSNGPSYDRTRGLLFGTFSGDFRCVRFLKPGQLNCHGGERSKNIQQKHVYAFITEKSRILWFFNVRPFVSRAAATSKTRRAQNFTVISTITL